MYPPSMCVHVPSAMPAVTRSGNPPTCAALFTAPGLGVESSLGWGSLVAAVLTAAAAEPAADAECAVADSVGEAATTCLAAVVGVVAFVAAGAVDALWMEG